MIAEFFVDTLLHQPLVVPATTNDQMETRLKRAAKSYNIIHKCQ
jgi:hypothetical protein